MLFDGANGGGWAGDQRHQSTQFAIWGRGLLIHAGLATVIAKCFRRNLAAGVAVDAALIDVEITGNVLRESAGELRHPTMSLTNADEAGSQASSNLSSPSFSTLQAILSPDLSHTCLSLG